MADKIQIDPAHPVGSLTAGKQQFTIAADTSHGHAPIFGVVVNDIPLMARNGVKHLMLEFPIMTLADIESRYPATAKAKTWTERLTILEAEVIRIGGISHLPGDPDIAKNAPKEWLRHAINSAKTHDFIEGIYAKPPRFSDAEIRERSKIYIDERSDDIPAAERNAAEFFIQSRNAGIRLHFSGDYEDPANKLAQNVFAKKLNDQNDAYPEFSDFNRAEDKKPGSGKIPEDAAGYRKYMTDRAVLFMQYRALVEAGITARIDPARELARVDRFIAYAGGEKAVLVWGAGHASKKTDFNEMLDARLGNPAEKTKVIELNASEATRVRVRPDLLSEEPDVIYHIREKKVEITPAGSTRLEVAAPKVGAAPSADQLEQYAAQLASETLERMKTASSAASPAPAKPADPARTLPEPAPAV